MKILLSWLKEYIDINLHPAEIAKLLTSAGLEVENITTLSPTFTKVVTAKVSSVQPHPNADKLRIATVTDGTQSFQVVCGAPNCREGIITALALVGASLPDPKNGCYVVKPAKLRGMDSFGMLCSARELGLSCENEGIMEFTDHVSIGADVAAMYGDTLFDISLTPNLNHCNSLIGVARELSAATGIPVRYPPFTVIESSEDLIENLVKVDVRARSGCPRYACRIIQSVAVGPSPGWLKTRIEAAGLRSINNVVDATNYVLLEYGHPLHPFDYDKIENHEVIVRLAAEGESFTSLDHKTRRLNPEDLLVCDQAKPLAIAGVMGGVESEVSDHTRTILLESAYFHPSTIRRTSKHLGLQTDSSKKFERGSDPNGVLQALNRAADLIVRLAGGRVATGVIDSKEQAFEKKHVRCRINKANALLGIHLGSAQIEHIFTRLEFEYECKENEYDIKVPTYRTDINSEIDIIEEIARIHGYDNIPETPTPYLGSQLPHAPLFLFERKIRDVLLSEGLQEFLTCDLIGPTLMNIAKEIIMPEENLARVLNPTSIEQSVLRTSLLPGLLQVVKYNLDHQNLDISGFELGRIHFKEGDQYREQTMASMLLTGKSSLHHWDRKPSSVDFYDLKGIIENLLEKFGIRNVSFKPSQLNIFHSGRQAAIYADNKEIGSMGEIHPAVQRRLDVAQRIFFAEMNVHDLFKLQKTEWKMKDIAIYPGSERDWTVTLNEETPISDVFNALFAIPSVFLEKITLIDLFRSDKLGIDKKNATIRFVYRDNEKTIEQSIVDQEHAKITSEASKLLKDRLCADFHS